MRDETHGVEAVGPPSRKPPLTAGAETRDGAAHAAIRRGAPSVGPGASRTSGSEAVTRARRGTSVAGSAGSRVDGFAYGLRTQDAAT